MHDTLAMNATRKHHGGGAPPQKEAHRLPMPAAGRLLLDEDDAFEFLQNTRLARPVRSHGETIFPFTFLEMRAAQLALMLAPPSRDAKYYGAR